MKGSNEQGQGKRHTLSSVLPSPYKVFTHASSGWYNRWLVRDTYEEVVPRLQDPLGVLI